MSRKVLVSYRFRDPAQARWVEDVLARQGTECEGEAVFWDTDPTEGAESAIKHEVNPVVGDCEAVLIVVSGTEAESWLDREVQLARKLGLGVAAARLPGVTDGVPNWIRGGEQVPIVDWGDDAICQALSQARRIH